MVKVALFVRLEAKPGKEEAVADFLRGGLSIVQCEPATTAWFAIQLGPTTFGIFDALPGEEGRPGTSLRQSCSCADGEGFRVISPTTCDRKVRCAGGEVARVAIALESWWSTKLGGQPETPMLKPLGWALRRLVESTPIQEQVN